MEWKGNEGNGRGRKGTEVNRKERKETEWGGRGGRERKVGPFPFEENGTACAWNFYNAFPNYA